MNTERAKNQPETGVLKARVKAYWSRETCGTYVAKAVKYTREYFDEIEEYRYRVEPEVFPFAQFTRFHGQKILEAGIGAGTDFIQWVRAGARAYGLDLTEEAVEHVNKRLEVYGLAAEDVRVADVENLPYPDNTFDLVYSWGVIQYTPDTRKALAEIIRVTRPGGLIKIMVYNRHSLWVLYKYLRYGMLRGRPFVNLSSLIYDRCAGGGARAFTAGEIKNWLVPYPVTIRAQRAGVTRYDLLRHVPAGRLVRFAAYILACLGGMDRCGWFMTFELEKTGTTVPEDGRRQ